MVTDCNLAQRKYRVRRCLKTSLAEGPFQGQVQRSMRKSLRTSSWGGRRALSGAGPAEEEEAG